MWTPAVSCAPCDSIYSVSSAILTFFTFRRRSEDEVVWQILFSLSGSLTLDEENLNAAHSSRGRVEKTCIKVKIMFCKACSSDASVFRQKQTTSMGSAVTGPAAMGVLPRCRSYAMFYFQRESQSITKVLILPIQSLVLSISISINMIHKKK